MKHNIYKPFTLIILIALLTGNLNLFAQNTYSFRVLANKGQNMVKSANLESQLLKTGAKLIDSDEISIAEGGYVGLVHVGGKTVELKSPGTYNIQSLSEKVKGSSTSLASKY